jgi:tetratricopeptide (TPR) repeat protein
MVLLFCGNAIADSNERDIKLDHLFEQLKKINNVSIALEIENKIWKIWSIHPSNDRRGYRLTELLAQGSFLMAKEELNKAYEIFSQIILVDPNWSEAWNKRATVLYLLGRYQQSQKDIDEVLKLEKRHFGALSGQGLVQIKLGNYEKAIKSYQAAQKIYPSIRAAKVMIPQLKKLIKDEAV